MSKNIKRGIIHWPLFSTIDRYLPVTVCEKQVSYDNWIKTIKRALGKKILEDKRNKDVLITIYTEETDCFHRYSNGSNIINIIKQNIDKPTNIRITIEEEHRVILVKPASFLNFNDSDIKMSIYSTERSHHIIPEIIENLEKSITDNIVPTTICLRTTKTIDTFYSLESLYSKLGSFKEFQNIRIDVDDKSWIFLKKNI